MTEDRSYGVIPFRVVDGTPSFLLVWERWGRGHWGFPKGHPHEGESKRDTALRELSEETGLAPQVVLNEELTLSYTFRYRGWPINKVVKFFLALMGDEEPKLQEDEIGACRWMTLEEVLTITPHLELKDLAVRAHRAVCEYQQG
jgi:8-oxo-dGTP pyrophosphatase MutT (NUDIX family)